MKKYKFKETIIDVVVLTIILMSIPMYLWSADYTTHKKIDGLADVSGSITAATLVPVQDMADNSETAAKEILPSQTYDAISLGINGVVYQFLEYLDTGLYIAIANLGTGSVVVSSRAKSSMAKLNFA